MINTMSVDEFENIKQKVNKVKEASIRAKGVSDRILSQWKTEFEVNSEEECESKMETLKDEIEKDEEKKEKTMNRLENLADWDSI